MKEVLADVTAISVTYESAVLAETIATTLLRFEHVIIVDNASRDGSADRLTHHLPHAHIVRNTVNKGFGSANNQAMTLVKTRFALLLNPDCDIQLDALQTLFNTAACYPDAAIIAPQGWRSAQIPQPSYRQAFFEKRTKKAYLIPDGTCSAKWLHGCCLLIRVDAFRKFGGFDERFFLYYEDDDLCLHALQAGYDCLLEPHAQVLHIGDASSMPSWRTTFFKQFQFFRSRHLIIGKYLGKAPAWRYSMKTGLVAPFAVLLYTLLLRRKHALKWLAWGCSAWFRPFQ